MEVNRHRCDLIIKMLLVALWGFAMFATAASYTEGKAAFDQGDYAAARTLWLEALDEPDPNTLFHLGVLYDQGLGVARDDRVAFQWYEKAAVLGHPTAEYNLGNAYKHGRGTVKSEELASYWWQKAADHRVASAQFNLAIQYYQGLGVDQDRSRAIAYFHEAASYGHEKARRLIASGQIPPPPSSVQVNQMEQVPGTGPVEPQSQPNSKPKRASRKNSAPPVIERHNGIAILAPGWLLEQLPKHYTLQLAVMANMAYIESFLTTHELKEKVAVVRMLKDGKPVHYLLLGDFPNRERALAYREGLPAALKAFKPWVREFADIQALVSDS